MARRDGPAWVEPRPMGAEARAPWAPRGWAWPARSCAKTTNNPGGMCEQAVKGPSAPGVTGRRGSRRLQNPSPHQELLAARGGASATTPLARSPPPPPKGPGRASRAPFAGSMDLDAYASAVNELGRALPGHAREPHPRSGGQGLRITTLTDELLHPQAILPGLLDRGRVRGQPQRIGVPLLDHRLLVEEVAGDRPRDHPDQGSDPTPDLQPPIHAIVEHNRDQDRPHHDQERHGDHDRWPLILAAHSSTSHRHTDQWCSS